MSRPARITIHTEALRHNLLVAKQAAPHSNIMPAVKANAYGHGMVRVATTLADLADGFIVACMSEALQLREEKIANTLLVIQGPLSLDDLKVAVEKDIRLVIHDESQLDLLAVFTSSKPVRIALKLDTGMHRLGIESVKTKQYYSTLKDLSVVHPDIWLMTHLACADDINNDYTQQQISSFNEQAQSLTCTQTIANSAGILAWPDSHKDWVRPGIMIYGSSPINDKSREDFGLRASMTFSAPLIAIHALKKGDAIGYGSTYKCPADMKVGVVACGYADGYPRHVPSGTPVFINGKTTQILGRVSMDLIVVDLSHDQLNEAKIGQLAELWGNHIDVDAIAQSAETISYELLCHAGASCKNL
ncbi:MAG TPA: alanine racemase [Thiothrix sp.]|nr:alanine racemase [Thiothrix sp.]